MNEDIAKYENKEKRVSADVGRALYLCASKPSPVPSKVSLCYNW